MQEHCAYRTRQVLFFNCMHISNCFLAELPSEEGRLENMESLLKEVHSTVAQLGRIQQTISMES